MANGRTERDGLTYYVPGHVVLLVDHPPAPSLTPERLFRGALRRVERYDRRTLAQASIYPSRVLTVQPPSASRASLPLRAEPGAFSLIVADVPGFRDPQALPALGEMIDRLNLAAEDHGAQGEGAVTLRGASPNWLCTPCTQNAGGGSPGSRPVAVPDVDARRATGHLPFAQQLREVLAPDGPGQTEVEVVILDAAPRWDALERAYYDPQKSTRLLRELLGPKRVFGVDAPLAITYADECGIRLPRRNELRVRDHDYVMSDHGLFIAGLAHTIAPTAKIRLIEVMNEYGVGTLRSIARALQLLAREHAARPTPLIINCSFGLAMPLAGHPTRELDGWGLFRDRATDLDAWQLFDNQPSSRWDAWRVRMRRASLTIESLCAALFGPNVRIVAAAGNDGDDPDHAQLAALGLPHPQARYPAAFPQVIGVGALLASGTPAAYSNLSDRPKQAGCATLGGATTYDPTIDVAPLADEQAGLVGVYIGDYPRRTGAGTTPNTTGLARWSGTSFAAPLISGSLAALAAREGTVEAAVTALQRMLTSDTGIGPVFAPRP